MAATATVPQNQRQSQTQQPVADDAALLNQILDRQKGREYKLLDTALGERIEKLRDVLPKAFKDDAARLVHRAMLTFERTPFLHDVTPASFIRCVLGAAEMGLAIDGRLAHAVPYNTKYVVNGRDEWRKEAQLIVDYKGVIAVARRTGVIADCYARIVREGDHIEIGNRNGDDYLEHRPTLNSGGAVVGAYAIVKLPSGKWRYEWMSVAELNGIRNRSKSYNGKGQSPWKTDEQEMQKKTVVKRLLKTYADDPGIARLLAEDDDDYTTVDAPPSPMPIPTGRSSLRGYGSSPSKPETSEPTPIVDPPGVPAAPVNQDADDPPAKDDVDPTNALADKITAMGYDLQADETWRLIREICGGDVLLEDIKPDQQQTVLNFLESRAKANGRRGS